MKLLLFALCYVLVPTASATQANPPAETSTLSVRGKVLQEPDGQPIRKANVQLSGRKGPGVAQYSAVTGAEGQFTIDDVQPGRYVVIVEHPGFVQSSAGSRISISVQPGNAKNDLILHMQPAAVITGKIVDLDHRQLRGSVVSEVRF